MKSAIAILLLLLSPIGFAAEVSSGDEALVKAAEKLVADADANKADTTSASKSDPKPAASQTTSEATTAGLTTTDVSESDIPLSFAAKSSGKDSSNYIWRMLASIAVLAVVFLAAVFATKRWGRKKDKGGNKARIEIMHQLHLGPRKSMALIRVSGEAMLVGITDHNINMIKPVTLIDDELEGILNKDFNNFLGDEFSVEDVRSALGARV
jgi:flagellar protein FliO/FliZ